MHAPSVLEIIEKKVRKYSRTASENITKTIDVQDLVSIERPLELRIRAEGQQKYRSIAVTMRTPGADEDLTTGFLYTEGIIKNISDMISIQHASEDIIEVVLAKAYHDSLAGMQRNFYTSSSCGICSKGSLDQIEIESSILPFTSSLAMSSEMVWQLIEVSNAIEGNFDKTGGCHSMALFDHNGQLISIQEDVGRHNAMDKLIGKSLNEGIGNFSEHCIVVSGRLSYELVQKASMMGTPILIARGAPTSLAIDEAYAQKMCLIGFAGTTRFNIYSGSERITNNG